MSLVDQVILDYAHGTLDPNDLAVLRVLSGSSGAVFARDLPRTGLSYGDRLPKLVRRGLVAKTRQCTHRLWGYSLTDAGRTALAHADQETPA